MTFEPKRLAARLFGGKVRVSDQSLRRWNFTLAALYGVQGTAILLFSAPYRLPLNVLFLTTDSLQTKLTGQPVAAPAVHQLAAIPVAWPVAAWLFVMALLHLMSATVYRTRYEASIKRRMNTPRWLAYEVSWALMLMTVGLLTGLRDIGSLLLVAALAAVTGLSGFGMEAQMAASKRNQELRRPYSYIALKAGLASGLVIVLYMVAAHVFGNGRVLPVSLYFLVTSILVLSAAFAVNGHLIATKRAAWANYAYGECWYMLLGLTISTAAAWQIFAAVLHP